MYRFICERIFEDCSHTESGEKREEVLERAARHLEEHHDHDRSREDWTADVIDDAMIYLPR